MERSKKNIVKLLCKIFGILILVVGVCLLYFGFYDFVTSLVDSKEPSLFICSFLGIPIFSIGIALTVFGFTHTVSLYIKKHTLSASNDDEEKILVKVKTSSHIIAEIDDRHCSSCGTLNDVDSKFCKSCGTKL